MNRRVRFVVAALFALSLIFQTPVAFAAARQRDRAFDPGFIERIVKTLEQALKPFLSTVLDDDSYLPTPPRP